MSRLRLLSELSLIILRLPLWSIRLLFILGLNMRSFPLGVILSRNVRLPQMQRFRLNQLAFPDRECFFAGGTFRLHTDPLVLHQQCRLAVRALHFKICHFSLHFPLQILCSIQKHQSVRRCTLHSRIVEPLHDGIHRSVGKPAACKSESLSVHTGDDYFFSPEYRLHVHL